MPIINKSAEHHFITTLEKLSHSAQDWMILRFGLSMKLNHEELVSNIKALPHKIEEARNAGEEFVRVLSEAEESFKVSYIYTFSDHDIIFLVKAENSTEKMIVERLYKKLFKLLPDNHSSLSLLASEIYYYQKLADKKLLSSKRFAAYEAMGDTYKVKSIGVRRERREDPTVMFVEDDRFTAAYASNILNKDYDVTLCRNGEDAIATYIDLAPDIVFLDINLPGLSGHDTLQAIKSIDNDAYVVMLSVDTAKENILKASEEGACTFIKKPFSKDRLLNTVRMSPFIRTNLQSIQAH